MAWHNSLLSDRNQRLSEKYIIFTLTFVGENLVAMTVKSLTTTSRKVVKREASIHSVHMPTDTRFNTHITHLNTHAHFPIHCISSSNYFSVVICGVIMTKFRAWMGTFWDLKMSKYVEYFARVSSEWQVFASDWINENIMFSHIHWRRNHGCAQCCCTPIGAG